MIETYKLMIKCIIWRLKNVGSQFFWDDRDQVNVGVSNEKKTKESRQDRGKGF